MIRCLKLANDVMTTNIVKVYFSDTDVFLLLLSHSDKINCQSLFMCLVKGNVDIKLLFEKLGNDTSKALLTLYALTGCDTTGKFEGKSKQFWFRRFLAIDQQNTNLVKLIFKSQKSQLEKSKVSFAEDTYTGQIKMLRERCMKQLHLMLRDTPCLQRSSLKEKSYHQPRMHSNIIYLVLIFNFQFGALHVILESIILIHCIMVGN